MTKENKKHTIYTKEYISKEDYEEIKQLQSICFKQDQVNLKLELDYRLFLSTSVKADTKQVKEQAAISNEFFYYIDNVLAAYLGISCFGGDIGELNGMTHPDWRGMGLFHKLFSLAVKECQNRYNSKVLLLSDHNSESGTAFIKSIGGTYDFSEYRMKLITNPSFDEPNPVILRIAQKSDKKKIAEINANSFGEEKEELDKNEEKTEGLEAAPEEDTNWDPNTTIYMIELSGEVIGKIQVEYNDNTAFTFGFGILPDFRGKGYGKAALKETLRILTEKKIGDISLDVVGTNSRALSLYTGCGFEQQSTMDYYSYLLTCNQKVANI